MNWKDLIKATLFLILTSVLSALLHLAAKFYNEIEYTILGFMAAIFGGIFYGFHMGYDIARSKYKNEAERATEECSYHCFGTDVKEEKNPNWHDSRCLSFGKYISDGCRCMR